MRKILFVMTIIGVWCCSAYRVQAQTTERLTMRDAFLAMPDTLCPYLTKNNKLDMVDFIDAKMKAEVTNMFDGRSELTKLTNDSLLLNLSSALRVSMTLHHTETPIDSIPQVILVAHTYTAGTGISETVVKCFSLRWRELTADELPADMRRQVAALRRSTLAEWENNALNAMPVAR